MVSREYPKVNLASQTLSSAPKSKSQFSWCTYQHPRRPGSSMMVSLSTMTDAFADNDDEEDEDGEDEENSQI